MGVKNSTIYIRCYYTNIKRWLKYFRQSMQIFTKNVSDSISIVFKDKYFESSTNIVNQFQKQSVQIDNQNMQVADKISQWNCYQLNITKKSQMPKIILMKQISAIVFNKLSILAIRGMYIQSLEHLSRMFAPSLQQLCLHNNNITNLRPLSKLCSEQITKISIIQNKINQYNELTQANLQPLLQVQLSNIFNASNKKNSYNFLTKLNLYENNCQLHITEQLIEKSLLNKLNEKLQNNLCIYSLRNYLKGNDFPEFKKYSNWQYNRLYH